MLWITAWKHAHANAWSYSWKNLGLELEQTQQTTFCSNNTALHYITQPVAESKSQPLTWLGLWLLAPKGRNCQQFGTMIHKGKRKNIRASPILLEDTFFVFRSCFIAFVREKFLLRWSLSRLDIYSDRVTAVSFVQLWGIIFVSL